MSERNGCPRCGGDCLSGAKWRDFTVPVEQFGCEFHRWAMCKALREPILLGGVKKWQWVEILRAQMARAFGLTIEGVAALDPIVAADSGWSGTEVTTNGSAAASYVTVSLPPGNYPFVTTRPVRL
jgi:hypothetical protein